MRLMHVKSLPLLPILMVAIAMVALLPQQLSGAAGHADWRSSSPTQRTESSEDRDTDGDGLSDYAEIHKYRTDPRKRDTSAGIPDGDWKQRKEFTYTITTVMRILKPLRPSDMCDDYQDARVLAEDRDSYTMEITYYPLNSNYDAIGDNPNWRRDDAGMTDYLKPTPTENWDPAMRRDLLAKLRADGIDPEHLTDRETVEKVSAWAFRRARTTDAFSAWFVSFPNGKPMVAPELRSAFDAQKPDPSWSDERMFGQELLGKQMFTGRVHGSCTSSAIYLATILRALGIPTRIIVCIPPVDPNDERQVSQLLGELHHYAVRDIVEDGITDLQNRWCNHLFNEVYVGHRWVRLNYNSLGQNILDRNYFGLLTHIYTCKSLSDMPIAESWGRRFARYKQDPTIGPRLTSINPYMLLKASDHFGKYSSFENPAISKPELKTVTVSALYRKGDPNIPSALESMLAPTDLAVCIREWLPDQSYHQLRRFASKASHHFVLTAPGYPDVDADLDDYGSNFTCPAGNQQIQGYFARITPDNWRKLAAHASYTLVPSNTSDVYRWTVAPGVTLLPRP